MAYVASLLLTSMTPWKLTSKDIGVSLILIVASLWFTVSFCSGGEVNPPEEASERLNQYGSITNHHKIMKIFASDTDVEILLNGQILPGITKILETQKETFGNEQGKNYKDGNQVWVVVELPTLKHGAYLLEIYHPVLVFPKYRLEVGASHVEGVQGLNLKAYVLNDHLRPRYSLPVLIPINVHSEGLQKHFISPESFNILTLLHQPLVILGLVVIAMMWCFPKLQQHQLEEVRQLHLEQLNSPSVNSYRNSGGDGATQFPEFLCKTFQHIGDRNIQT